jgi:hypothetical protein
MPMLALMRFTAAIRAAGAYSEEGDFDGDLDVHGFARSRSG